MKSVDQLEANMTTHYLNRGTRYHIGSGIFNNSVDRDFVGTYPVIGLAWAQPFAVSHDDEVVVSIENLWGVDYGSDEPHSIHVYIGATDLGQVNVNRAAWTSSQACRLQGGATYLLKIVSLGPGDPDDFVFEGVRIETAAGAQMTARGQAKVLQFAEDDYFTSSYDTSAPQTGALTPKPVVLTPQPAVPPIQTQLDGDQSGLRRDEKYGVTGKWALLSNTPGDPPPVPAHWLLHFHYEEGFPAITFYGRQKDFPERHERWGNWVKDETHACMHFHTPECGYEGGLLKKFFVELKFRQVGQFCYNVYRLYCGKDEAEGFVEFWNKINR
jgi:hypothetical protein